MSSWKEHWVPRYSRPLTSCRVISRLWPRSPSLLWRTKPSHSRMFFSNRWLHILTGLFITEETGRISHVKPEKVIVPAVIAGQWERKIKGEIKAGLLGSNSSLWLPGLLEFAWCFLMKKAHICTWSQWPYFSLSYYEEH